ncbi:GTP-binding protein [Streptomyces boninensis]|uniref:GTP-binding protein n=1 Tax=Streptomyces boninensis TaxID=2039455 RepID=UPI003B2232D8
MSVLFAAVGGFLGAGKTTTLTALARALEARGRRVGIITNDQGEDLVDTLVAASSSSNGVAAEVTGGCFCCRFEDLLTAATRCVEEHGADVILAEAVGSCTDLQATVVRPLRRLYGDRFAVAPLVTVVDPARFAALAAAGDVDLAYLFDRQVEEADVVGLNKADLGGGGPVREALGALHPGKRVVGYSARTGAGVEELADVLTQAPGRAADRDMAVDYDRYAAAEAELAWLNHAVEVRAAGAAGFESARWAEVLLGELAGRGWVVGHIKVLLTEDRGEASRGGMSGSGITKASAVGDGSPVSVDTDAGPMHRARARINARVAAPPAHLDAAIRDALAAADMATAATSSADHPPASFAPSYPQPVHRLPA